MTPYDDPLFVLPIPMGPLCQTSAAWLAVLIFALYAAAIVGSVFLIRKKGWRGAHYSGVLLATVVAIDAAIQASVFSLYGHIPLWSIMALIGSDCGLLG